MNKDYTAFTAEQLLNDDFFLNSELNPTIEGANFWKKIEEQNSSFAKEIETARFFLRTIKPDLVYSGLSLEVEKELWTSIQRVNRQRDKRRIYLFSVAASIAASISLALAFGWYTHFSSQPQSTDYLAIMDSIKQVEVPSNNTQLFFSDNKQLSIDGKDTKIEYQKEGDLRVNSEKINITKEDKKPQGFNQLIVPAGKRSSITFADGTKIWVNANSRVIYPVAFAQDKREIFVEGEIYLDVSRDEHKPFIVKTKQMDVKVLGTQFNISAYENEPNLHVVLISGKVEVKIPGKEKSTLSPNQMLAYDNQTNVSQITHVNTDNYIAWVEGYYKFHQKPLRAVLENISKYYGASFEVDKSINGLNCSGKLDLKNDLQEVLTALGNAAPIEIEKNNESFYIKVKP